MEALRHMGQLFGGKEPAVSISVQQIFKYSVFCFASLATVKHPVESMGVLFYLRNKGDYSRIDNYVKRVYNYTKNRIKGYGMTKKEFAKGLDQYVKLVRAEYGFNQITMADMLGMSKKTLVEIEKERSSLGWTGAVALCTLFSGSRVLADHLGGDAGGMIRTLAFSDAERLQPHRKKSPVGPT